MGQRINIWFKDEDDKFYHFSTEHSFKNNKHTYKFYKDGKLVNTIERDSAIDTVEISHFRDD